jgi:hypothetical protein
MQMGSPPRVQGLPPTYRCSLIKVGCPAASAVLPCCSSAGSCLAQQVSRRAKCVCSALEQRGTGTCWQSS